MIIMDYLLDVILIDDSAFDLFIYEKLLHKSGLTRSIKSFNSAREALKYLIVEEDRMPPTLILLDLQMPDMNGFEFIDDYDNMSDQLKSKVKIFMLSSTIDSRDIEKAKSSSNIIGLLPKPLDVTLLKTKLNF
jgi:response regulator RpfG family c-di-GMP phosphodiesterase